MNRYRRLVWGLLFFFLTIACRYSHAAETPNVFLIISDDQAWTDYSFMRHPRVQTPHIDRLARESLTFTRGHVPSSLCCPSLASIITGLYPHQHRITSNDPSVPAGMTPIQFSQSPAFQAGREVMNRHLEAVPTLPRVLKEQGYLSLQTGKWWQGHYRRGGFTHGMTEGQRHGDRGLEIGRATMQPIYDFLELSKKEHKPFFVWYAPLMPHEPHTPPERLLKKYQQETVSPRIARYWGMVEWFDETVGELLGYLDKQDLAKDTMVVFLADNGWIQSPDRGSYAPKSKQSPYEGGLRTPLLLRWPGKVQPRTSEIPVLSIDIMPTLLAAIGLQPTSEMQGINLLDEQAVSNRKAVCGECFTHNAVDPNDPAASLRWRWTIEGPWKLIIPDAINEPNEQAELYDLVKDPHENTNLASQHADVVARLSARLNSWWNPVRHRSESSRAPKAFR
jgi:uncharacterized sulfatase